MTANLMKELNKSSACRKPKKIPHTVVVFDSLPTIFTQNIINVNQSGIARIDHSVIGDENNIHYVCQVALS